jgi:hypothetical protein
LDEVTKGYENGFAPVSFTLNGISFHIPENSKSLLLVGQPHIDFYDWLTTVILPHVIYKCTLNTTIRNKHQPLLVEECLSWRVWGYPFIVSQSAP